ncbi:putative NADPH-dependent FMN reductase [Actinokineospora spheciospongiae]|uniref:Putative NADPH-dependent FMN reductase n=1 Tax=Actinokineospora spheciospongiae TaxID=909613 RepID=W7J1C2_9PSEU|nr:NAD(P)H-dependent oxidoreductase [Actinokineospora spheciospongiae]EWC62842.1 putative NADPH-dependent FMN reductase [Actinokineospora spheciospongiae]PWW62473.1 NAD(P)H-dependent FMN reductase [Actinokineospora spheciospongiae]
MSTTETRPRPLVVAIGGTGRPGSSTERALLTALSSPEAAGCEVRLFGGEFLAALPMFRPGAAPTDPGVLDLVETVGRANGVLLASPAYHGGVSAMVKNALDHLEHLADRERAYLDGRAVGCFVTAAGWQAGGATLSALRSIVHALRGWPTPLGITVNTSPPAPGDGGEAARAQCDVQLRKIGWQVAEFATRAAQSRVLAGMPT